jgi:hypothetical protein
MSWAQTAIIPMNIASEASAAASSTKTFNIPASRNMEQNRNNVPFLFSGVKQRKWVNRERRAKRNAVVNAEAFRGGAPSGRDEMKNKSRRDASPDRDQTAPQPVRVNPEREYGQTGQRGDFEDG